MDGNVAMYEIKLRTECILICINNRGGLNEKLTASHEASDILLINFLPVFLGHIRRIKPDKEATRVRKNLEVESKVEGTVKQVVAKSQTYHVLFNVFQTCLSIISEFIIASIAH
jgi:hypothetical protein